MICNECGSEMDLTKTENHEPSEGTATETWICPCCGEIEFDFYGLDDE